MANGGRYGMTNNPYTALSRGLVQGTGVGLALRQQGQQEEQNQFRMSVAKVELVSQSINNVKDTTAKLNLWNTSLVPEAKKLGIELPKMSEWNDGLTELIKRGQEQMKLAKAGKITWDEAHSNLDAIWAEGEFDPRLENVVKQGRQQLEDIALSDAMVLADPNASPEDRFKAQHRAQKLSKTPSGANAYAKAAKTVSDLRQKTAKPTKLGEGVVGGKKFATVQTPTGEIQRVPLGDAPEKSFTAQQEYLDALARKANGLPTDHPKAKDLKQDQAKTLLREIIRTNPLYRFYEEALGPEGAGGDQLLEEAKRRVTNLGSREAAEAAIAQVPEQNRAVFQRAIEAVYGNQ